MRFVIACVVASAVTACGASQGTHPHDMSQAEHQAAAQQEEKAAAEHQAQHDPAATAEKTECGRGGCWTSATNPTKEHTEHAQQHRELAGKHRAASAALAAAEAKACAGISEEDRDMSPFAHREDIKSVTVLEEEQKTGKGTSKQKVGATVVFRALPGMTAEWLQRVVDCHLARSAAVGHDMPEMAYCPLMPKGATASVTSTGDGFAVNIKGGDPATVDLIIKRAQSLGPAPGGT